jgi:hypothetical protein
LQRMGLDARAMEGLVDVVQSDLGELSRPFQNFITVQGPKNVGLSLRFELISVEVIGARA